MAKKSAKQLDAERLLKSVPELFGKVARKLLMKEEDPFTLSIYEIERNGTMAKRTIRVLQNASYIYQKTLGGSETYAINQHLFNTESPPYAEKVQFTVDKIFTDIQGVLTEEQGYSDDPRPTLATSGQRSIKLTRSWQRSGFVGGLNIGEALHVWWNRDDYVFNGGKNWSSSSKPKTVLLRTVYDKYIVEAARAAVDVYVKHNLHILLPAELGLNVEGSNRDDVDPEVPNFMHHATFIDGPPPEDLEASYKAFLDVATSLYKTYHAIRKLMEDEGGLKPYLVHLRKQAIHRLSTEAPLHIHQKSEGFDIPLLSRFVLENLGVFDYDTLYGEATNDPLLDDEDKNVLGQTLGVNTDDNIKYQEILQALEA